MVLKVRSTDAWIYVTEEMAYLAQQAGVPSKGYTGATGGGGGKGG